MSGGVATWYNNSYNGPWSRTARLRVAPYMPPAFFNNPLNEPTSMSTITGAVGPNGFPLTAAEIAANAAAGVGAVNPQSGAKKRMETFFGPDVGVDVDAEKGWLNREDAAAAPEQAHGGQKLPLSVVKDWIEKSKDEESVHPTTTLQALVNLKRPTLSLVTIPIPSPDDVSPAAAGAPSTPPPQTHSKHTLRFLYDSSAPQVKITLTLHHRVTSPAYMSHGPVEIIYSGVHASGFGKVFELPKVLGMDLEAGMERERPAATRDSHDGESVDSGDEKDLKGGATDAATPVVAQTVPVAGVTTGAEAAALARHAQSPARRMLGGLLGRRNRQMDLEAGMNAIELQNQANPAAGADGENPTPDEEAKKAADEDGLRILIKIEGLDAEGKPLTNANAQLNHILVTGALVAAGPAPTPTTPAEGESSETAEAQEVEVPKKWVWMVKVVRREALIGSYTFLLKEIYGLSSTSGGDEAAATPAVTYPPAADAQASGDDAYGSTSNECIVCLTNPRDVVLLPCRHLVVCRECAVGMVEFGAGGKVARREETAPTATGVVTGDGDGGAMPATTGGSALAPAPVPAPPTRERRRKKAKGWFCPVCRQPYTSLLRLALPSTMTPQETVEVVEAALSRVPSRASRRSVAGHSLRRVGSRATLPERGEKLLESLVPGGAEGADVEDEVEVEAEGSGGVEHAHEHVHEETAVPEEERPQFVLGDEVETGEGSAAATHKSPVELTSEEREQQQADEMAAEEVAKNQSVEAAEVKKE